MTINPCADIVVTTYRNAVLDSGITTGLFMTMRENLRNAIQRSVVMDVDAIRQSLLSDFSIFLTGGLPEECV